MQLYQPELLPQPLRHLPRHRAVAPGSGFVAELLQVAVRRVALRHVGVGQGVAQVGAEVELAHLRDAPGVGDSFGAVAKDLLYLCGRFQEEMMIGADEAQGLVDGGVVAGGHQRVLQPVAFRRVVVDIVGRHDGRANLAGQNGQVAVAPGVPVQEVLLKLHEHRVYAEPFPVVVQ